MPIDICPNCGEQTLVVHCNIPISYEISNIDGGEHQSWDRVGDLEDKFADPEKVVCESCRHCWFEGSDAFFHGGYLIELMGEGTE